MDHTYLIESEILKLLSILKKAKREERIKRLLNISVWTDEDIQPIIESQNLINQL